MMVPEHLLSMPYTHVTPGRVWKLGSLNFVSQSSACGAWLGMSYCLLYVASCTGGDHVRSTCMFHSSQLPVPLEVNCLELKMSWQSLHCGN